MPTAHASVNYVEPNLSSSGLYKGTGASNIVSWKYNDDYERAPRLEDYSIYFNLEVEVCSRENISANRKITSDVLILSYRTNKNGTGSTVNFMGGTKVKCNDVRDSSMQYLTTNYADMYVGDLINYGTTEMIGVKSIDIEYQGSCVPIITVKFTDVRGLSLFQPTELSRTNSYEGIKGLNSDNVAQSFFQCFFRVPMPRFTMTMKGFYGKPVTYECMCDKFDTNFNSKTGDFDITTRFIGYSYSFLTDVSIDALFAAPYSDYGGKNGNYNKYWDSEKKSKRFTIWNKEKTELVEMPTLFEIWEEMKKLLNDTDSTETSLTDEEQNHTEEIEELQSLRSLYKRWYEVLFNLCSEKYGKDFCYLFKQNNSDENYYRLLILTRDNNENSLHSDYEQFNDEFKRLNQDLYAAIKKHNEKNDKFKILNVPSLDFSEYNPLHLFNRMYLGKQGDVIFNGFDKENRIPETQVVNNIFNSTKTDNTKHKKHILNTIYDNGVNQFVNCYSIDLDYSAISDRINALQTDANRSVEDKTKDKRIKELNQKMFSKMCWYPTVENFTRIMIAHFETLMQQMYSVATNCEGRTAKELGVTTGLNGQCIDVNSEKDVIPPFPRITKNVLGEDGIVKVEDTWVGEYKQGTKAFEEIDFIDGFFNAIEKMQALRKDLETNLAEQSKQVINESETYGGVIKHPVSAFDFYITKNPYGDSTEISNDLSGYQFAGKVCARMFNILYLSHFANDTNIKNNFFTDKNIKNIARVEADNFYDCVKITNDKFLGLLRDGILTSKSIVDKVTSLNDDENCPWGNIRLFSSIQEKMWMIGYTLEVNGENNFIYPIQNTSFSKLDEIYKSYSQGNVLSYDGDISIYTIPKIANEALLNSKNGFGTILITENTSLVDSILNNANSNYNESYNDFYNLVTTISSFDSNIYGSFLEVNEMPSVCSKIEGAPSSFYVNDNALNVKNDKDNEFTYNSNDINNLSLKIKEGNSDGFTITEVFGIKNGKHDYESSFINSEKNIKSNTIKFGSFNLTELGVKGIIALLSIHTNDSAYESVFNKNYKTFTYLPKLCALKIGAICFATGSINNDFYFSDLKTFNNAISSNLGVDSSFIDVSLKKIVIGLSKQARYQYAAYFYNWCSNNDVGKFFAKKLLDKTNYVSASKQTNRSLLNQDSDFVKAMTKDLLSAVLIINLSVNVRKDADKHTRILNQGTAIKYLDAFIERLNEIYKINYTEDANGNLIKTTDEPKQTTDDMKSELYRYMKQLYDKWIPMSSFDDWKLESFFVNEKGEQNGHTFYFIDSYYNYIGDKLLINPKNLMERIDALLGSGDINAMMLGFMADIYAFNRCMMKCIQNFADLIQPGSMTEMFLPMPFNSIDFSNEVNKYPSFVIVYPYEPSKNLNIPNNEYNDDTFMLNDENETPKAIRSKSDKKGQYRLPAFGVSYGKQYQSYFKSVNINMKSPVATQQSIQAKHFILQQNADVKTKGVVGQDLYDIYSTQSYTCDVEMMGCAWVQPMMYFVLLNIPMFRGSYMIMKVRHSIKPGDMTTTFTGCRMANVSNKLIENIFTDDDFLGNNEYHGSITDNRELKADIDNDCPYKVYPLWSSDNMELTGDNKQKAKQLMDKLMSKGFEKHAAAGIVGNMFMETSPKFDHTSVNGNDKGYIAGGLCQWNDSYYNLTNLLKNNVEKYGQKKNNSNYWTVKEVKNELAKLGVDHQIDFIDKTIGKVTFRNNSKTLFSKSALNSCKTAREAALSFEYNYERSDGKNREERANCAEEFYNSYDKVSYSNYSSPSNKDSNDKKDVSQAFFDAVNRSAQDTPSIGVRLKNEVIGSKKYLKINQENGNDKLGKVFDMILNSEYYNYVEELVWVYPNGGLETRIPPISIYCIVSEKVDPNKKRVWFTQKGDNVGTKSINNIPDGNQNLLKSLAKRGSKIGINNLKKEIPQMTDEKVLEKYKPQDCGSLFNSGKYVQNYGINSKPSEISKSDSGQIDGWNVGNAVSYLKNNASVNSKHKCATYVELAIQAGGGPLSQKISTSEVHRGSIYATNLHYDGILSKHDFVQIYSGEVEARGNFDTALLQAGDVCIIGKNARVEGGKYHACMWCGDKWRSDFVQNNMNVYPNALPFFIYRYKNKKLS